MIYATTSGSQVLPVTVATDWWTFGAMAMSAVATLAVVVVAVLNSRRANRRAMVAGSPLCAEWASLGVSKHRGFRVGVRGEIS